MAIIKFDSEKADALIRDLKKISSDIESNMGKVYTNSFGKEINLSDSRLKVYAYRNKTIDVYNEEDGTTTQEIVRERYLKHDFVSNARAYNQHVRNLYKRSNSAKTKATQSIERIINSLNKIKSLISEFETEQGLRLSSSLDDVGTFDFNFLSAYGPMGRPQNYSPSFGTIVAEDAYTLADLGVLGRNVGGLNLEKLKVFDGMFEIAKNNELTYQEKFEQVHGLLMENVLDVNPEELDAKTKLALESMEGILNSEDVVIDDELRKLNLVKLGINVIDNLDGDLAIDIQTVPGVAGTLLAVGDAIINGERVDGADFNIDINQDGKPDLNFDHGSDKAHEHGERQTLENLLGINSDVTLDKNVSTPPPATGGNGGNGGRGQGGYGYGGQGGNGGNGSFGGGRGQGQQQGSNEVQRNNNFGEAARDFGPKNDGNKDHHADLPKIEKVNEHKAPVQEAKQGAPATKDVIDKVEVEKPRIQEEAKITAEEIAIDRELQSSKITMDYKDTTVTESSESSSVDIQIDESAGKKGAGVLAGAAGLGALSKMGGNAGANVPQVNGMAAGEILGINQSTDASSMGMMLGDTTTAAASTGNVSASATSHGSVGGESTADRGSLNTNNSNSKSTSTSATGRGGSTLEDKDNKEQENSYGKPNKPEDAKDDKKGMLGDASIAELEAKDDKQVKIATGVTAGTVLVSGVLAVANVLPWIMLILALIAIGTYAAYRIKKKKDKEKRRAALAAKKAEEAANATVTLEAVENVNEVATVQPVVGEASVVQPTEIVTATASEQPVIVSETPVSQGTVSDGEFSSQPYEPSRDGVTEIAIPSNSETEK